MSTDDEATDGEPTTTERVHRHLARDPTMASARARGYLSLRRAARWLLEGYEWEATEEGVVSAIRRYEPPAGLAETHGPGLLARAGVATELSPRPDAGQVGTPVGVIFPEGGVRALRGGLAAAILLAHGSVSSLDVELVGPQVTFLVPADQLEAARSLLEATCGPAREDPGDR